MTARFAAAAALVLCATIALPTAAQDKAPDKTPARKELRVCQDPNNLPFSNTKGEGIENRIAALLATQGVSRRPSLRSWDADLKTMHTGDGRSIPPLRLCSR